MSVAARRVTRARSPETVSPSTNIRRPSTGSVSSKSISSRQGSWPSARAEDGTVTAATARTATAAKAIQPMRGLLRLLCKVSALCSRPCLFPPSFCLRLPNQRIRPLRRSLPLRVFLRSLRRLRRRFPRHQPQGAGAAVGGLRTGAGGALLTSWDSCPA